MQNWKIVVIGSIRLFIGRENSCTRNSQLLRSEKINIELTPPLRYHPGCIWARAPWALWYHLGSLELSMHSRHSCIQSIRHSRALGIEVLEALGYFIQQTPAPYYMQDISYCTILLANCIDPIRIHLSLFVFLPQRQTRGMREDLSFYSPISLSTFDLPGDRKFVFEEFWEAKFVLQLWERITSLPHI